MNEYLARKKQNRQLSDARRCSVNQIFVNILFDRLSSDQVERVKQLAKSQVRLRRRPGESYRQFRAAYARIFCREVDIIARAKLPAAQYDQLVQRAIQASRLEKRLARKKP